ncbi:hypothetical protein [Shewanella woodyi]|uniref:hypothetical protein n=1 Tax=Shewanella woodyi TaxID=60961 RepID=UPI00374966B4
MSKLAIQIESSLPEKIVLPVEIRKLLDWLENIGMVKDFDGNLMGSLPGTHDRKTEVEFYAEHDTHLWWCFDGADINEKEISERVFIFARTGCDGSSAAFWLGEDGVQRIVHIGSGSGSDMICVLASEPIDFIKLLAIGYEEICWGEEYENSPSNSAEMNRDFKEWVKESFNVSVPSKGSELIQSPAVMWDLESRDPFCRWLSKLNEHNF